MHDRRNATREIARRMLEQAETFVERQEAVRSAMHIGMPLHEIEEHLDWLDLVRSTRPKPEPRQ